MYLVKEKTNTQTKKNDTVYHLFSKAVVNINYKMGRFKTVGIY